MARSNKTGSWRPASFILMLAAAVILIGIFSLRRDVPVYPPLPRSVDVIVVGEDLSGEVAALSAAQAGADVLYINLSEPDSGGISALSPAFWASSTPYQNREDVDYTPEAMALDIYERGGTRGDFNQILHFSEQTAPALLWLEGMSEGDFSRLSETNPALHLPAEGNAAQLIYAGLEEQRASFPFAVDTDLEPHSLLYSNQQLRGLIVQNSEGEVEEIYAQAIILAGGEVAMSLADEAGALFRELQYQTMFPIYLPAQVRVQRDAFPGALLFDSAGAEVEAEEDLTETIEKTTENRLYVLYGDEGEINAHFEQIDTVTELADLLSLPQDDLADLIADFEEPYHVATLGLQSLTPGGVTVDEGYAVLDEDGPISGLFATGQMTGGLHGRRLIAELLLSETITSGRIAGHSAAQWARR